MLGLVIYWGSKRMSIWDVVGVFMFSCQDFFTVKRLDVWWGRGV
jgi:hypothetical protein